MSVSELSVSSQNYLKAIWSLREWSEDPVTTSALAAKVGVRQSTVSDAVRKLAEQGLVEHAPYGAITLSAAGLAHAVAMVRRHRLIETFLVDVLGYRWDQVHDEAEHLEHAVSDFLVERIDQHLGHPSRDPHGDPIPTADGVVTRPDADLLTAATPGGSVRVERISDADPGLLAHLTRHGIGVGTVLGVLPGTPYSEALEISVHGAEGAISLGRAATDAIWVSAAGPAGHRAGVTAPG